MKDKSCKTPRWRLLKAQLNNLGPKDFLEKIRSSKEVILLDVRTATEFSGGAIDQAVNIDYLSDNFWERIEQLPSDVPICIYCRTGRRSIRTCTLMRNGGFDNDLLFNLEGGYIEWVKEID